MVGISLECVIVGQPGTFDVTIDDGVKVSVLKKAIKEENKDDSTMKNVVPKNLQLYLAKKDSTWLRNDDPGVADLGKGEIHPDIQMLIEGDEMTANWTIKDVFDANHLPTPQSRQIHVLVALPPGTSSAPISDGTDLWLTRFLHNEVANITSLPTRGDLNEFIGLPLPVKIGLPQSVLQAWSSPVILGQVLRDKLFEVNDVSPCQHLERSVFSNAFLYPQVDGDATESAFHYFWDSIIRVVLGFVFHRAYVNRDSSRKSSSGLKRPDFLFALDHVCVFRGEEKEPRTSITVPREELSKKLVWSYGGVPYIFGYAASGFELELFAIYQDVVEKRDDEEDPKNIVKTHRIGGFNLQQAPERFRLVLALLNLCLLFPVIVRNCPASAGTEFMDIHRGNGVKVRLSPTFVDKIFCTQEEYRRVKLIYDSLKPFGVPCADAVVTVDSDQLRLTLMPRGIEMKPCSLSELFVALRNVLEALVVLHRNGWMHRDIRWSNVIKRIDRVEWYLIDFADAAQSPQNYPSGDHLTHDEHASEIFVEGGFHTTAVDLWAVGYLVKTSKIEQEWIAVPERGLFLDLLMNTDPIARPTADEALQLLSRIEREAEQESQGKGVRKKHRHA